MRWMRSLCAVWLIILLAPTLAAAATVTLSWDANTEGDLAGYKLYRGTVSAGPYVMAATLGKVTTYTDTVADGNHCWVLTAFDASGNESSYSNEVCKNVDTTAPAPPGGLTVTVTITVK